MGADQTTRFVAEAREHLAGMSIALLSLEKSTDNRESLLSQLLRSAHSIKGGAGFSGFRKIEELSHAMETAVEKIRDVQTAPGAEVIDALLGAFDRIAAMVDDPEHSSEMDISELVARLGFAGTADVPLKVELARSQRPAEVQPSEFPNTDMMRSARQSDHTQLYGVKLDWFACERENGLLPVEVAKRLNQAGTIVEARVELLGPSLHEGMPSEVLWYRAIVSSKLDPQTFGRQLDIPSAGIVCLTQAPPQSKPLVVAETRPIATAVAGTGSLRISVSLIDRMMGLAGELVLARNQALRLGAKSEVSSRRLLRRLDEITNDLQGAALRMRMQPVAGLFDRFPRLVRDLARQLNKQIELRITGAEVELDKTIIELLIDPLTHLVRNCCDHGIEAPDIRSRTGKSAVGTINLAASQERGQILITIRDDGRGIDREAIKRKAVEQGIGRREELDRLGDRQLFDLILRSGFSTASKLTDLSGRGVGMDVVKTNLEQVGGVVEIESEPGRGTLFTLRLPLTLAIVPCLLVSSGGRCYALPQRDVQEIVLLGTGGDRPRIEYGHDEEVLRLRGKLVSLVRLSEVLSSRKTSTPEDKARRVQIRRQGAQATDREYVAVVRVGSQPFGLVLDEVLASEDVVVKPLHAMLRPLSIFAGATILGDGKVSLILSAEGIARHSGVTQPSSTDAISAVATESDTEAQPHLLFRAGEQELLAMPLSEVRRVVRFQRNRIERVGNRDMVNVDGAAVNVLSLDKLLGLSPCPDRDSMFLILPRHTRAPVGVLASEIVDTPALSAKIEGSAFRADGISGSAIVKGRITVCIDLERIVQIWQSVQDVPALPNASAGDAAARRVLVVEDTQFFQQLVTKYLNSNGFETVLADNGAEGLARLKEGWFDLVVSDIEMPVMDGLTFAREVRQNPAWAAMPMVALTTLNTPESRARAIASGFDAYEVKLDRQTLLATVSALLEADRTTAIVNGGPGHG